MRPMHVSGDGVSNSLISTHLSVSPSDDTCTVKIKLQHNLHFDSIAILQS